LETGNLRVHIILKGVVQMVGFRYFTLDLAREYGITGFVRNKPDGTVELEAEGKDDIVKAFINELRVGPRAAHITGFDIEELEPGGDYDSFRVLF
jgi:acylphosphatase